MVSRAHRNLIDRLIVITIYGGMHMAEVIKSCSITDYVFISSDTQAIGVVSVNCIPLKYHSILPEYLQFLPEPLQFLPVLIQMVLIIPAVFWRCMAVR